MAKGGRRYVRDAKGRFASTGSGGTKAGGKRVPYPKSLGGGKNRITRDNGGRITSVGGNGATMRGARLKTEKGNTRKKVVRDLTLRNKAASSARREVIDSLNQAGRILRPVALGGMAMSRTSPAAKKALTRERQADQKLQGIKQSILAKARGKGTIQKPRGLKPDPNALAKAVGGRKAPKATSAAKATKLGARVNPAIKDIGKAKVNLRESVRVRESARSAAMTDQNAWGTEKRNAVNKKLNDASYNADVAMNQLRHTRLKYPVQTKTRAIRAPRIKGTVAKPGPSSSSLRKAQSNLARGTNKRNYTGKSASRTRRVAENALAFYSNPVAAMSRGGKKRTNGFMLPRPMRRRR